jgi:hypothetical protein
MSRLLSLALLVLLSAPLLGSSCDGTNLSSGVKDTLSEIASRKGVELHFHVP